MYIAIYCVFIVVFAVAIVLFFYFKNKSDKLRHDAFNRGEIIDLKGKKAEPKTNYDFDKETEELEPKPIINVNDFEDFELDMSEDTEDNKELLEGDFEKSNNDKKIPIDLRNEFKNLFDKDINKRTSTDDTYKDFKDTEKDIPNFSNPFFINNKRNNINLKNKIQNASGVKPKKSYAEPTILPVNEQEFPNSKRNPKFSIPELDALANFDFDSLKDKSEEEIKEIIKDLPQKARDMILKELKKQQ